MGIVQYKPKGNAVPLVRDTSDSDEHLEAPTVAAARRCPNPGGSIK